MPRTLVVAEKPSVARDIARVLGAREAGDGCISGEHWVVTWALGHLVSLCDPEEIRPEWKKWRMADLPLLPPEQPTKVLPKTKSQYGRVAKLMKSADISSIVCATDSGREGELIFRFIYQKAGCAKPVKRLWISSMTDAAIREGFAALRDDSAYDPLYVSALSRAEADWLVGMNASRAFTLRYDALLSVGRVQTPTLALLVARDAEIDAFVPRDYWEIRADFGDYQGLWQDPETKELRCFDEALAARVKKAVKGARARVTESEREKKRTPPPLLYDLTTLQREANGALGFSAARTLELAQSLYEKRKLITYPRTDSRFLPRDMKPSVERTLRSMSGELGELAKAPLAAGLTSSARVYNDAKVSDHHAIVPTGAQANLSRLPEPEAKLYDMIARRLLAVQYPDYEYESARVITEAAGHAFRSSGTVPLVPGWHAVYPRMAEKANADETPLPPLSVGDERDVREVKTAKKKTKPPERLTDATLLKAMETAGRALEDETLRESMKDAGLGTPATRAAIIERLIDVGYAKRSGKALASTDKGRNLISAAPGEIASPATTGRWEKALTAMARADDAAAARALRERFMAGIRRYAAFLVDAAKAAPDIPFEREEKKSARTKRAQKTINLRCPVCGQGALVETERAFGCSRWREGCKFTIWKTSRSAPNAPAVTQDALRALLSQGKATLGAWTIEYKDGKVYYHS